MSHREDDLRMLKELLEDHGGELTPFEVEGFAGMRFDLTVYEGPRFHQLSDRQREWVVRVHQRVVPDYANLASRGLVPKGIQTPESKALDAMLAAPKVLKLPPRKMGDE